MFARSAFTTASRSAFCSFAPASRQGVRRFASEAGPQKGTQFLQPRNFIYVAGGAVAAAFGLYWVKGQPSFLIEPVKPAVPALTGGDEWVDLKLIKVEPYNHNTKQFVFELPSADHVSGLKVTSCVLTKYQPEGGKPIIRPYTPISDEDARGYMTLLVKKYDKGPMSTQLHSMVPEQRLLFKGPLPKYPWEANKHDHIALIAGGTGITPMWQLIRGIFKNKEDKTKITLVFGNIKEEDILLRQELAKLENEYPQRFRAFYTLDSPPAEFVGNKGFITKELLKQVLPEPKSENIKVFVCGPPGLMNHISGNKKSPKDQGELTGILKELGYSQDQVYKF